MIQPIRISIPTQPPPTLSGPPACPVPQDSYVPTQVVLTKKGVVPLQLRPDGGLLVEPETGTVAYRGQSAMDFLAQHRRFDVDTEVIVGSGQATLETDGKWLRTDGTVAIMLPAGSEASCQVEMGENLLVITNPHAPHWYERHHSQHPYFDELAKLSERTLEGSTRSSEFPPQHRQALVQSGLVSDTAGGTRQLWDKDIRTPEELKSRLQAVGIEGPEADRLEALWSDARGRAFLDRIAGSFPASQLAPDQQRQLVESGLARMLQPGVLHWQGHFSEAELRSRLAGCPPEQLDNTVALWRHTTLAGYDHSGLAFEHQGVAVYTLNDKRNLWAEGPSEWLINSTNWAGANKRTFTVGVSEVHTPSPLEAPVPFRNLRPAESLHAHPDGDATQTEAYMITRGAGAILTADQEGNPRITVLRPGDLAIVEPGVTHQMLAAAGDYQQLCFQVPSAFQYGLRFKEDRSQEHLRVPLSLLEEIAVAELARGGRGTYHVTANGGAPTVLTQLLP